MIYYSTWEEACNSVSQTTPSSDILQGREIGRKIFNLPRPPLPPLLDDTLICLDYITFNNTLALRRHCRQKRIQKHILLEWYRGIPNSMKQRAQKMCKKAELYEWKAQYRRYEAELLDAAAEKTRIEAQKIQLKLEKFNKSM